MKTNRVYLKTVSKGTEVWYVCTPTEYLDKKSPLIVSTIDTASMELLRKNGKLKSLGFDSVKVPAVTKPAYQNVTENDNEKYTTDVENIAKLLLKNGITTRNGDLDTVKLEVWISGFNTEKRQLPYAYVVINDTLVYESELSKKDDLFASFFEGNLSKDHTLRELLGKDAYVPYEFHGNGIKPLASVDAQQMERVKDFAVFHCVHKEECSETILIDGKEVRLPKQNVGTQNQNKIAFVPIKTEGNITQYDIYRSTDKGLSWNRVAENYRTTAGDIAAIEIPTHQDVVCYFNRNGETESRYILSEDGGATWSTSNQKANPNAELKDAAIGNSVIFGSYELDDIYDNGKEELEWIVLDRVGDKVLLLAKYGVFLNKYDSDFFHEVTWEDSFLRGWLQKRFYADAFTAAERAMIEKTVIHTPNANGGDVVSEDYVFLLSASEASNGKAQNGTPYFTGDSDRALVPAARVLLDGSLEGDMEGTVWHGPTCVWWLRSAGSPNQRTAVVNRDGSISEEGMLYYAHDVAIRPAVWVDVTKIPQ